MGDKTGIEWTDATWNPVTGCSHVSVGCANCYAESVSKRWPNHYPRGFKVHLRPERLEIPIRWRKPRRIFVCSMSDLFHPDVSNSFQLAVWDTMRKAEQHTFQILTKRPARMRDFVLDLGGLLPNVWLGVSVENQATADERIPVLLETPAAVRFVSCEPLLGPVDLREFIGYASYRGCVPGSCVDIDGGTWHKAGEKCRDCGWGYPNDPLNPPQRATGLDWVIAGGESGPRARPAHPDWFRSLRDQCQAAGVPFFFKQWGEFAPGRFDWQHHIGNENLAGEVIPFTTICSTERRNVGKVSYFAIGASRSETQEMVRVGKKAAGSELDGETWKQMPGVR